MKAALSRPFLQEARLSHAPLYGRPSKLELGKLRSQFRGRDMGLHSQATPLSTPQPSARGGGKLAGAVSLPQLIVPRKSKAGATFGSATTLYTEAMAATVAEVAKAKEHATALAQLRHQQSLASLSSSFAGRKPSVAWGEDERCDPSGRFFQIRAGSRFVEADLDDL